MVPVDRRVLDTGPAVVIMIPGDEAPRRRAGIVACLLNGIQSNSRMNRQRCVLQDAVDQYTPLRIAQAFPAIADSANRNIETDIKADQIPAFVTLGKRVKAGHLTSLAFTQVVIDTTDPDYPKMRDLVQQALLASDGTQPSAAPAPSGSATSAAPAPRGSDDPLAAPQGNPIVDTAAVCG